MTIKRVVVPVAALALGLGSSSMVSAQAGERHHNRPGQSERSRDNGSDRQRDNGNRDNGSRSDRGERDRGQSASDRGEQRAERRANRERPTQDQDRARSQDQDRQREQQDQQARQREERANRDRGSVNRDTQRNSDSSWRSGDNRDQRGSRDGDRNRGYDSRRDNDRGRSYDRGNSRDNDRYRSNDRDGRSSYRNDWYRGNWSRGSHGFSLGYYAPRRVYRSYRPSHRYGSGGRLSLYFSIGSGYRYGSPYSGRVYGYRRSVPTYGSYISYGDVRLRDFPRDAAVYVDGYYAGVVDDFDGFFQRLTLEVGPHEIEVEVPGDDSQFFDVYVDPYNTIDLHGEYR